MDTEAHEDVNKKVQQPDRKQRLKKDLRTAWIRTSHKKRIPQR